MATASRTAQSRRITGKNAHVASLANGASPMLDHKAPFMGKAHKGYFKQKLLDWKHDIERDLGITRASLQSGSIREADANDRASNERDWSVELRRRDRQRKLIGKIDDALKRLEDGQYGYCVVTGEPISLERLDARPIATMTIEAQERHERDEKQTRDE